MGFVRIQDEEHNDVIRISFTTGKVEVLNKEMMDDAAGAFWDAIETCFRASGHGELYKDFIVRDGGGNNPGDFVVQMGHGAGTGPDDSEGRGQNINVMPYGNDQIE